MGASGIAGVLATQWEQIAGRGSDATRKQEIENDRLAFGDAGSIQYRFCKLDVLQPWESHAMNPVNPDDFCKRNGDLRMRDYFRYGSKATVLRDGHFCSHCEERIPEDDAVGPINIVIWEPALERFGRELWGGAAGPETMEREFCTWECAADWFAVQAGRTPQRASPPVEPLTPAARSLQRRRARIKRNQLR